MPVYTDGSKLYATEIEELHEFAQAIGLPAKFYVEEHLVVYYYIGGGNPALLKAIAHGAQCITPDQVTLKQRTFLAPPNHGIHN